jgi:hypothetical protein
MSAAGSARIVEAIPKRSNGRVVEPSIWNPRFVAGLRHAEVACHVSGRTHVQMAGNTGVERNFFNHDPVCLQIMSLVLKRKQSLARTWQVLKCRR